MTEDELKAIEDRANAATEGPWLVPEKGYDGDDLIIGKDKFRVAGYCCCGGFTLQEDADFVSDARADIPALIAEVRRLREENKLLSSFNSIITDGETCDAFKKFLKSLT